MNDMNSLFIATTILALGGLGLFMLKSNNSEERSEKNSDEDDIYLEENNDDYKSEGIFDDYDHNELSDFDREVKKSKNDKTRRNKKKQRASRRRM